MKALGYQQVSSLSSAAGLTVPAGTLKAVVVAETQDVRWRDDGTDPAADTGMLLPKNTVVTFDVQLSHLKFIETTTSAKLNVSYYG